jgi:hypothetical protein
MEEVDNIIIPILRDIGCTLPNDLTSIKQFDSEKLYSATVQAVNLITAYNNNTKNENPSKSNNANNKLESKSNAISLPNTMPPSKAVRFRLCSSLASLVHSLGYPSELGDQYYNICLS